jgi:hypothetical protein
MVNAGDKVGEVGTEGNVTGPHLHFERHKRAGTWSCSNMDDPMKSHGAGGGSVSIGKGKVFLSKLVFKQDDSDSVRRLQLVLNGISLQGGRELPITGYFGSQTRDEVKKWQAQKATDKSVTDGSRIPRAQADQLFAGTGHTVVDDLGITAPDPELPPDKPGVDTSEVGLWKWFSGKPSGEQKVYPDGAWHHLAGLDEPASGIRGGSEKRMLYLRILLPTGRTADRVVETKFVRTGGDETAMDSEEFGLTKDSHPYSNVHFEDGEGRGGKWYVKVTGGKDPNRLTTRYSKQHTTYKA